MMLKIVLNMWRFPGTALIYALLNWKEKNLIIEDLKRFQFSGGAIKENSVIDIFYMLVSEKAFQSVMLFRLTNRRILKTFFNLIWNPLKTIELNAVSGKIGPGFWISHNYMVVSVYSAGKNFRVGPGVVIGLKKEKDKKIINPIFGDDVYVCANATVVGGINIGDNVVICPGSVVVHDVPSNCTVAGNPATVIKQRVGTYMECK